MCIKRGSGSMLTLAVSSKLTGHQICCLTLKYSLMYLQISLQLSIQSHINLEAVK